MAQFGNSDYFQHGVIVRQELDTDGIMLSGAFYATARVITASGAITVLPTDYVIVIKQTTPAAVTVTLPSNPGFQHLTIKDGAGNCSAYPITVTGGTIDGNSSVTLNNNYASLDLIFSGTSWNIV